MASILIHGEMTHEGKGIKEEGTERDLGGYCLTSLILYSPGLIAKKRTNGVAAPSWRIPGSRDS